MSTSAALLLLFAALDKIMEDSWLPAIILMGGLMFSAFEPEAAPAVDCVEQAPATEDTGQ